MTAKTTQTAYNKTTGPSAGATLASLSSLAAGNYTVDCWAYVSSSSSTADYDNIQLTVDGNTVGTLLVVGAVGIAASAHYTFSLTTTTGAFALVAVGNASGGCIYHTQINALQAS